MSNARRSLAQRQSLAQEAARLMHEQGIRDFRLAKDKACARLGVDPRKGNLPRNTEIETALAEYLRLFGGDQREQRLLDLRRAALTAMKQFSEFSPRLVGDVLSGMATEHSDVQLHLFADQSESFDMLLEDRRIPYELAERRFRFDSNEYEHFPAFRFMAGDIGFEAVIFPLKHQRQSPRSLIDGQPMARAGRAAVENLLLDSGKLSTV